MCFELDFKTAIDGLIQGRLTVEQLVALASKSSLASLLVTERLQSYVSAPRGAMPPEQLIELQWRLEGPSSCVQFHFCGMEPSDAYDRFLVTKLSQAPSQFTDQDLIYLSSRSKSAAVRTAAARIHQDRISEIANALIENPKDLSADVAQVKERVSAYSFTPDLNALLDKVESGVVLDGDPFDQAALLKHLRTFFEKLHEHVAHELRIRKPDTVDGTDLTKCGQSIDFLCRKDVLTEKMRDFAKALYGVLSNEGVHAIKSERQYVRLCRNTVAEYALILFFELERRLA